MVQMAWSEPLFQEEDPHITKLAIETGLYDKYGPKNEGCALDWINMTKNQLEFDQKKFTPTNLNVGTWPKFPNK